MVFVWFDALAGYLSALGFPASDPRFERHWANAARRTHLIGKGILRFHAVYWPAILLSAGLPPPNELLVHGYVTVEGKKIGKSLGNAIDPSSLISELGVDALRWFLLRHVHATKDSDFSRARLVDAHDADLADQIGNLLRRALTLLLRHRDGKVPAAAALEAVDRRLIDSARRAAEDVECGFDSFALHQAASAALGFVTAINRYLDETRPWHLARRADERPRLDTVLYQVAEALRFAAVLLTPFVPATAQRIVDQLGSAPPESWNEAERVGRGWPRARRFTSALRCFPNQARRRRRASAKAPTTSQPRLDRDGAVVRQPQPLSSFRSTGDAAPLRAPPALDPTDPPLPLPPVTSGSGC